MLARHHRALTQADHRQHSTPRGEVGTGGAGVTGTQETSLGWEALALVEERIRRENLHRLELLRLKAYVPL